MRAARWLILVALVALVALAVDLAIPKKDSEKTISQRVAQYGAVVDSRLAPVFAVRNLPYPPRRLALLGFKDERVLEVWATDRDGRYQFIKSYPILGASGKAGPKLRQGDEQVPEGIYRIELLNPNSLCHLSLRVGYPNDFDRRQALRDGRTELGGDIMIHGGRESSGCLAMGDATAEDLFVLAAKTGVDNIVVILCPVDFRRRDLPRPGAEPAWVGVLYSNIREALKSFPESEVSKS
ncbi:MAG TPA: L,D-transpeptidase family protein [Verrucomicrobiae bacterium]|nr:L,D-transpeptidase family protein [Verrucomicrobiae bacterium]